MTEFTDKFYNNQTLPSGKSYTDYLEEPLFQPQEMHNTYYSSNSEIICLVNTTGPKGAEGFAEQLTWKLLDKREYESVEPDASLEALEGTYSGRVNGREVSVEVSSRDDVYSYTILKKENETLCRSLKFLFKRLIYRDPPEIRGNILYGWLKYPGIHSLRR